MLKIPSVIKRTMFCMLASQKGTDELLLQIAHEMHDESSLASVTGARFFQNIYKYPLKMRPVNAEQAHPLVYLAKCKRFEVLKIYSEVYRQSITFDMLVIVMQNVNANSQAQFGVLVEIMRMIQFNPSDHPEFLMKILPVDTNLWDKFD